MFFNPVNSGKNLVARYISVMAVALMAMAFTTKSAGASGWLRVVNIDHKPVTITFTAGHCYAGDTGNGKIWDNVAPGAFVDIYAKQDPQTLCDGEGGHFSLQFSNAVGDRKTTEFTCDNGNGLWLSGPVNPYPGQFGKLPNGFFVYTTIQSTKLTAGKAKGSWQRLCSGNCDEEYSTTLTNQTTKDTTVSEETRTAVSVSLSAGIEFGPANASVSVTAESEKTVGKTMSEGVLNAKTTTKTKKFVRTPEQMKENKIHAAWQWVAKTELSNGQTILVESESITCTPDGNPPNYLPDSKEDVGTCNGALANQPLVYAPPVVAPPVPVVITDYSGTFMNDFVTLTSQNIPGQPGSYSGTVVINGKPYNFRAQAAGDALRGEFSTVNGNFPFESRRNGNAMTFSTGGAQFQLAANNPVTNPNPPATPNVEISVLDTRAWPTYKRPTGLTLRCPADWKVLNGAAPNEASWTFTPPIVVEADRGNIEVYLLSSEPSRGIQNVNDPRIFADVEGEILKSLPFLRRAGVPHTFMTNAGAGVIASWEGQNNDGLIVIANAHWIIRNNNLYLFLAMGEKSLVATRESVVKGIFASFAPSAP